MYITIAIHRPKPGQEAALLDAMERRRDAAAGVPGLQRIHALHDLAQGVLVGLAIWDSRAAFEDAWPTLREVNKDDDFSVWEDQPAEFFHLIEGDG